MQCLSKQRESNQNHQTLSLRVIKCAIPGTVGELWKVLKKIQLETSNDISVGMHHINMMCLDKFRKLVEAIFHGSKTHVIIYTNSGKVKSIKEKGTGKAREPRRTYALIVDKKEEYNTTLNIIKKEIKNTEEAEAIKAIKAGKDGNIIITLERDEDAANDIKKRIQRVLGNGAVRLKGAEVEKDTLHIRGMDATTTKEEVISALKEKLGEDEEKEMTIGDLRPYGRSMQAVTIKIKKEDAEVLMKTADLKVGMVRCRIERHINISRCKRCWAYDHMENTCAGPDRKNNCYKCGKDGHTAIICTEEEECVMCNEKGHTTGSGKCKFFKSALDNFRRRRYSSILRT